MDTLGVRWMWADACVSEAIPGAQALARRNPLRWSAAQSIQLVAQELRTYDVAGANARRPVRISAATSCFAIASSDGFEMEYKDVAHAVKGLQQYELQWIAKSQHCIRGHPLEVIDNIQDRFRCDTCTVTADYALRCRRCAFLMCDKCSAKLCKGLITADKAPIKWDRLPSLKAAFDMVASSSGYLNVTDEKVLMRLVRAFGFDRDRLCEHVASMDYDTNGYVSLGKLALWADKHVVGLDLGLGLPDRKDWQLGMPNYWSSIPSSPTAKSPSRLDLMGRLNSTSAAEPTIVQGGDLTHYPEPVLVPVTDGVLLRRFHQLLSRTHKPTHNWTRDRQGASGTHDPSTPVPQGYELVGVVRNENAALWRVYQVQREVACLSYSKSSSLPRWIPMTMTGDLDWSDHDYRNDANEWLLLHSGRPESLEAIARDGFTMTKRGQGGTTGSGGLYGEGLYCAESITKVDEYARGKVSTGVFQGCRAAAVVRVLGGHYFYTDEDVRDVEKSAFAKRVLEQHYDSTIGDRLKLKNTFREYVVYDASATYLEYIIYYRRLGLPPLHQ